MRLLLFLLNRGSKFLALCFLLIFQTLSAQIFNFANYSLDDGLPHGRVDAIAQDEKGYLWIAHHLGVSKFDGKEFKNFYVRDGLADNKSFSLLMLSQDHFILGHDRGQISEFKNGTFHRALIDSGAGIIFNIHRTSNNELWFASERKGAFRLKKIQSIHQQINNNELINYNEMNGLSRTVTSFAENNEDFFCITDLGIKQYHPKENKFSFLQLEGVPFDEYTSMTFDQKGTVWLGTMKNGLYYKTADAGTFNPLLYNEEKIPLFISRIYNTSQNKVFIGTWGGGLLVVESDGALKYLNEDNGLAENKIRCIFEDREGNIWIGTQQNGLSCFKGSDFKLFLKGKDNKNNQVNAILESKHDLIYAGTNAGLYILDPKRSYNPELLHYATGSEVIEITSLCEDNKGQIWIGTRGKGVYIYFPKINRAEHLSSLISFTEKYINKIYADAKNNIWIGSISGISMVQIENQTIKTYGRKDGLSGLNVVEIFEYQNQVYAVPDNKPIHLFINDNFELAQFKGEQLMQGILTAKSFGQSVWIGTEGNGLFKINENSLSKVQLGDNLNESYIHTLLYDDDSLIWLGTTKGLIVYDLNKQTTRRYDRLSKNKRIETKQGASFKASDGSRWFGTINGLLRFDKTRKPINQVAVNTIITGVQIHFADTALASGSELAYKNNHITFYFSGICFTDPTKVSYKYRLNGYDDRWQILHNGNAVTFSNLLPGNYLFEVIGSNNDDVWDEYPAQFYFYIKPPIYLTWWFYLIIAVGVLLIIIFYIKFRERQLHNEKKMLEKTVKERTSEILKQKEEIENQRDELAQSSILIKQKNLAITDSIQYAKRIQLASLPDTQQMINALGSAFIFYRPKDIVSGDFYAFAQTEDDAIIIATADCTGHGVPGAFMSMIGTNLFNQIVREKKTYRPSEILNQLNEGIIDALKQEETDNHDGMDVAICKIDLQSKIIEFAGANRPLWILKNKNVSPSDFAHAPVVECYNDKLLIYKPDKMPIGGLERNSISTFTNHSIQLDDDDLIILFTDGYVDQFGGAHNKKMLTRRLKELLSGLGNVNISTVAENIEQYFELWKGNEDQVDDILVIGIRV
jgi:ligand-binding sensor domain-containing protein/serine phosphatase RsbU (regulator of sigma subunit)